jgi:hypothetical protein
LRITGAGACSDCLKFEDNNNGEQQIMDEAQRNPRPRPVGRKGPRHDTAVGEPIEDDAAIGAWCEDELKEMQLRFEQAISRELRPKRR